MGNKNSGRKPKSTNRANAEMTLAETSPHAAAYLQKVVTGEIRKPSAARIDVCKYILNQDLGVPRQKVIHAGKADQPFEVLLKSGMAEWSIQQLEDLVGLRDSYRVEAVG